MLKTNTKPKKIKIKNQRENLRDGVKTYTAFWRANTHRFVADYLQINLHIFQMILVYMMDKSTFFLIVASRGLGKSFLIAVYCCARAILYPHSKIIVSAGTIV